MALILDTGPLYATLDRDDAAHRACRKLIQDTRERWVIPAPVLIEVDCWIHQRLHPGVLLALLDDIDADAYRVEDLESPMSGGYVSSAISMPMPISGSSTRRL